jgi:DNA-binding response OmpR family regulator
LAFTHVLLVESKSALAARVKDLFERSDNFCVETASNVREALKDTHSLKPDFIVIDLNSDFIEGFELTSVLQPRRTPAKPVLVLQRRGTANDSSIVRRKASVLFKATRNLPDVWVVARYRDARLDADFCSRRYIVDGRIAVLTQREQAVLRLVIEHLDHIVPRAAILEQLWGYETRSLDVHIQRLRKKLAVHIETLPGFGYRFVPRGTPEITKAHQASHLVASGFERHEPPTSRPDYSLERFNEYETRPTRADHIG